MPTAVPRNQAYAQAIANDPAMAAYIQQQGWDPSNLNDLQFTQAALHGNPASQQIAHTNLSNGTMLLDSNGNVIDNPQTNWFARNPWIFPLAGIGTGVGLEAAGVGAGAGAGTDAAAGTTAATTGATAPNSVGPLASGYAGGTTAAGAPPASLTAAGIVSNAPATAGSLWGKIAPWVSAGSTLASSVIGYNAAKTASQQQVAASQQALGLEQGVYNNSMAALSPFSSAGARAITTLRGLTGNN